MCGRYFIDDETYTELRYMMELTQAGLVPPGDVYPTALAPVITRDGVIAAKWGFPRWKGSGVIINARAETAAEKKMFSKPLAERRCVVPSCGFYEWERKDGNKTKDKYLIRRPGESVLFMAGITDIFRGTGNEEYSAFVVLTTAASKSVSRIHDRMPVILESGEREVWLEDGSFTRLALERAGPELELKLMQPAR